MVSQSVKSVSFQAFIAYSSTNQHSLNTIVSHIGHQTHSHKLTMPHYLLWHHQFVPLLESQDLMGYLDGSSPVTSTLSSFKAYLQEIALQDQMILILLYAPLIEECMAKVVLS